MSKIQEILSHLSEPVKFDTPVVIKATPHSLPVIVYSLEKTSEGEVMVQINDGSFHKLEETDRNYDMVSNSLLQRLRLNENKMNTETKEPENLMDGLFSEMNRVREIIKEYEDPALKGAGMFAAFSMKMDIKMAEKSIKENDVIEMLRVYSRLKEYER